MSVCLCNLSADAALEFAAQKGVEFELASPNPMSFSADPALVSRKLSGLADAPHELSGLADALPKPVELMLGSAKDRRSTTGVAYHVWRGGLPRNSFLRIDEGVYVTSPELTLLMQANQLHQVSLCQVLGRYLGTWTPTKESARGQDERAPLVTFDSLVSFCAGIKRSRGKSNLKLAMAYTCDGAASAPETSLQLALCLPPELHGFNLPQPTMNYEVGLSSRAQLMYPHETARIDLCWRNERFGLEYQGEDHGNQLGEDYARWFALREEQYELWYVAKEQLASATQMDFIAREVAKRIGFEINEELWPTHSELRELLDILSGATHPKPVPYEELRKRRVAARACLRYG